MGNRADIQQRDVFISWTGRDVELKKKIADYLKTQGLNPLLSDEECQGDFEEWSRSASTSAHIFMPIITKNSLKSEGMKWELEEIDKKLCSPEKGFWKNAIVPVCESLEVYSEYKSMLSQEAQKEIRLISTAQLGDTQNPLSEQVLQTIAELVKNRIASHFFGLYRAKAKPNFIKLIPLNASVQDLKDQSLKIEDLYVFRRIIEKVENQPDVVHETPEKLLKTGNVSFICGPAGSGKTQYVNQIFNQAKEKLVIQLSCPKVSVSEKNLLEFTFSEFYRICGERRYYTVEHFKSLLEARELVLILDGLDEVVTKNATRKLIEKVEEYFKVYKNSTSVIFTGRNIKDGNLIVFGEVSATTYLLEKLTEEQIKSLGQNLFLLFGNPEKGEKFYVRVQDLNEEIRSNPLLLSQLAIVYNVSDEIPKTIVGILESVAEITFKTDSEIHSDISAIPSRFEDMISYDISDILKDFSRELYVKDPEKDGFEAKESGLSFKKIMQHVLGVRYKERGNALDLRTEFLLEYLQNRAIFCDGEFYHKMFLEYFTALSFWEECFDDYDGEIVDNRPIATLFDNYSNEYWREVIKLFLIKADSVLGEKQTEELFGEIFIQSKILDYTLLLETSKDLIVNKLSAYKAIITDILTKSVSGEYPAYGPLFWYVPEYNLYSELLLIANEFLGNAKALALIRDVCFICGNIYNASEFLLEKECENLFSSISESVQGVRKGLLELFFTGETSFVGGDNVYPRCFNVNEARAFMHMGHGLFTRMNTPFEDELGLFSHTQVNELNGEYIGFISMPYNKEEIERKLNEKSCLKVRVVAFAQTENKIFEYVHFVKISIKVIYIPENIVAVTEDCLSFFNLTLNPLAFENGYSEYYHLGLVGEDEYTPLKYGLAIGYLPKMVKKVELRDGITALGCACATSRWDLAHYRMKTAMSTLANYDGLEEVVLPNTLEVIESYYFEGSRALKLIEFPKSLKEIKFGAFNGCVSLTSVIIPETLIKIDKLTFSFCSGLTEVYFFADSRLFDANIFYGCKNIKRIYVNVNNNDENYFDLLLKVCEEVIDVKTGEILKTKNKNKKNEEILRIKNGVTIASNYGSTKIKKIFFPKSVTTVKSLAFFRCEKVENVYFSMGLEVIESGAFERCKSLTAIEFPNSLKEIGDFSFSHCTSLSKVKFGNSVEKIDDYAFYNTKITSIKIPVSVVQISNKAFKKCLLLKEIIVDKNNLNYCSINGDLYNKDRTKLIIYAVGKKDKEYIIPPFVQEVNAFFEESPNLHTIKIPASVVNIEKEVFCNCAKLKQILVDENNLNYCSIDGNLYSKDKNKFIVYCGGKEDKEFIFPPFVNEIETFAFSGVKALAKVALPTSIKEIKSWTFLNCHCLQYVENLNYATEIGYGAFQDCSLLERAEFSEKLSQIKSRAFAGCSSLQEVAIPNSVRKIGEGAFAGCTGLKRVVISINFKNSIKEIFGDIDENIITYV